MPNSVVIFFLVQWNKFFSNSVEDSDQRNDNKISSFKTVESQYSLNKFLISNRFYPKYLQVIQHLNKIEAHLKDRKFSSQKAK